MQLQQRVVDRIFTLTFTYWYIQHLDVGLQPHLGARSLGSVSLQLPYGLRGLNRTSVPSPHCQIQVIYWQLIYVWATSDLFLTVFVRKLKSSSHFLYWTIWSWVFQMSFFSIFLSLITTLTPWAAPGIFGWSWGSLKSVIHPSFGKAGDESLWDSLPAEQM